MAGSDKVQLRAKVRCVTMVGAFKPRDVFWATPAQARHLVENNVAEMITAGPLEAKPAGPTDTKAEDQSTKKSSPEESVSRSTDSVSSGESGKEQPSSASQADQVSKPITSNGFFNRGNKNKRGS